MGNTVSATTPDLLKAVFDHAANTADGQVKAAFDLVTTATQNGGLDTYGAAVRDYASRLTAPGQQAAESAIAAGLAFQKKAGHTPNGKEFSGDIATIYTDIDRVIQGGQTFQNFADGVPKENLIVSLCNDAEADGVIQPLEELALKNYGKLLGDNAAQEIGEEIRRFNALPEAERHGPPRLVPRPLVVHVRPVDVSLLGTAGQAGVGGEVNLSLAHVDVNGEFRTVPDSKTSLHLHFSIAPSVSVGQQVNGNGVSERYVTAGGELQWYLSKYRDANLGPYDGVLGFLMNSAIVLSEEGGVETCTGRAINKFKAGLFMPFDKPTDGRSTTGLSVGFMDLDGHAGAYAGIRINTP